MYAAAVFVTLVAAVSAAPTHPEGNTDKTEVTQKVGDVCGDGNTIHCCNSESADKAVGGLIGGINLSGLLSGCNDITATVIGGSVPLKSVCKMQAVCCGEVEQNGVVNLGCNPISVL
ncbi:hypothetical protein K4F52_005709 [Lecanicillium sp. MT-2017a]|nr:hypothetical protein K4F52_005709 [Lecanicillium sp. MT-2017a]